MTHEPEHARQVEALDRPALAVTADVRPQDQVDEAVTRGIAEFGKMDILISTEADMIEGGYQFHALKGMTFMPSRVIADTALYLDSDLAAAVSGVTTPVDPGHMLLPGMNRPRRSDTHQRSIRPGRKLDEEEPWQDE